MAVHMHVTPYERREQPAGAGRAGGHALVSRIRDSLLSHSARTSAKANALDKPPRDGPAPRTLHCLHPTLRVLECLVGLAQIGSHLRACGTNAGLYLVSGAWDYEAVLRQMANSMARM